MIEGFFSGRPKLARPDAGGEGYPYCPSLHYWEFVNVLRTLVLRRELEKDLVGEILDLHLEAPLEQGEPDRRAVLDTALEYRATVYDAVFISLCLSRELPLITAEKTTTAWVAKLRDHIEAVR